MTAAIDILAQANRVARRESLREFVLDATPGYDPGVIHDRICTALENFRDAQKRGECPRLAIFMPPRTGKSQIATRCFPAWALGDDPTLEIMVVSYSSDLANSFSYDSRDIVRRDWYADTFPDAVLETDRKGITRWRMTAGGGYNPIGIGGSITGSGADILILDDLFKSEQQANSAAHRDMVHDRYRSSIYNRLSPERGGIIMLMTRWHDDDLPGRLLAAGESGEGDAWDVLTFAAVATHDEGWRRKGESLHPSRWPLEKLDQIKANCTPSEWESLYQQNPIPEGGGKFDTSKVRRFDLVRDLADEHFDSVAISIDSAFKKNARSDRAAFQVWGTRLVSDRFPAYEMRGGDYIHVGDRDETLACFFLLDAWAGKLDFDGLCMKAAESARAWTPQTVRTDKVRLVIEDQANGVALIRDLERQEGVTNVFRFSPQLHGGKEERANQAGLLVTAGRVFVPHDDDTRRPWVRFTVDEWRRFPSGKYDDAVDSMSQALIYLSGSNRRSVTGGFSAGAPARRGWARHA